MVETGLISSLEEAPLVKWVWFLWSCVAFLGVLYLLWGPLRSMATERGDALGQAYSKNIVFFTVVWFLYPLVFLVRLEGLKIITDPASV